VLKHRPRWNRWTSILLLGLCVAAPAAWSRAASAATATNPRTKKAATGHGGRAGGGNKKKIAHAPSRAHGRAKKKVFLERHVAAFKSGLPNVQALGSLVIDGETGHEIFSRLPDKERPIASISKLAATLVVADRGIELDGLSTIQKGDLDVARGGARSRLLQGMTLSNRDLLHAALMGSDNRAIPALGRAVKLSPSQLAAAMTAKAKELGLKNTRFRDPTGLSTENVSTPRETITMLRAVMSHPVLGPVTRRLEYDAHPVGRPAITYNNTYRPAQRGNIQVLGGKTGYNDDARYCLVIATKIDGRVYYMSFLSNEGKMTRFGDVARVADWLLIHRFKGTTPLVGPPPVPTALASGSASGSNSAPGKSADPSAPRLPVGVAAPAPEAPETAVR
jgi:D-alanyl-D-alanine endopeptidase (penicillin-binding protein 7)